MSEGLTLGTGIPRRFRAASLKDYSLLDQRKRVIRVKAEVAQIVQTYLDNLLDHIYKDGRGLFFFGPPGSGKTLLSCIVLCAVRDLSVEAVAEATGKRQHPTVRFMTFSDYIKSQVRQIAIQNLIPRAIDSTELFGEWEEIERKLSALRNRTVVVIDDAGKEHTTSSRFAEDEFDALIRARYDEGLPTLLTSNLMPSEWNNRYNSSMVSFLQEAFIWVSTDGEDFREEYYGGR